MWTLPNGNFDWLEIYKPLTYFPFLTIISLYENINTVQNILMLILILTLKSTNIKKTAINFFQNFF